VIVSLVFVGSLALAPRLATEFFPKVDAGQFILNISAPEGTRVESTEALVAEVEDLLHREIPRSELDQVVANIGLPHGWMVLFTPVTGPHQAFMLVSLVSDHRLRTDALIAHLHRRLAETFPGVKFSFQTGGIVSDMINFGLPAPIDIKVSGPTLTEVAQAAGRIRDLAAQVPGTVDVQVRQGMNYPELHLAVNRTRSAYLGLNEERVVIDLVTGLSSNMALNPGYWIDPNSNNAYFVVAQYPEQTLIHFDDFLNTPLVGSPVEHSALVPVLGTAAMQQTPSQQQPPIVTGTSLVMGQHTADEDRAGGSQVLLRDLVEVTRKAGPETVDHYNLQRTMDVLVSVTGNDLGQIARRLQEVLKNVALPKDIMVTIKGEADSMRAALQGFGGTLPLAMVLIYLVMVGLFRSYLDPFVIMFAVPLGFIGVIWMLLLTSTSVNVESLIGTLLMIGIVVSNSVLLVDFANHRLRAGMPLEEAVAEAGRLRIRPILMTSLATVLGLAPLALGVGEGSEANMPLARAVIGGLLASTFMTLLFIPVLHVIARRLVMKWSGAQSHR
jgi:multidrug efflux pump subunit AcrB